jgi:hypothetical protein
LGAERFELHTENAAPYDVLLGRLGDDRLLQMGRRWQDLPRGTQNPQCLWFPETGHSVCDQENGLGFRTYWETHGLQDPALSRYGRSLALFGLPISEPAVERNAAGDTVLTQWFERARFEYHPGQQPTFRVLLGLLGNEIRSAPIDAPTPTPTVTVSPTTAPQVLCSGAAVTCEAEGEGVTIIVPAQAGHARIEVIKLPTTPLDQMPSGTDDWEALRIVINFEVRDAGTGAILRTFSPPMELRMNFTASDWRRAEGRPVAGFFPDDEQRWVPFVMVEPPSTASGSRTLTPIPDLAARQVTPTSGPRKNEMFLRGGSNGGTGFGTIYRWGDPNVAWGRGRGL